MDNDQNKLRTAFYFIVDCKQVRGWAQNKELIRATKLSARKFKVGRQTK